jgi:hypothetical protein
MSSALLVCFEVPALERSCLEVCFTDRSPVVTLDCLFSPETGRLYERKTGANFNPLELSKGAYCIVEIV